MEQTSQIQILLENSTNDVSEIINVLKENTHYDIIKMIHDKFNDKFYEIIKGIYIEKPQYLKALCSFNKFSDNIVIKNDSLEIENIKPTNDANIVLQIAEKLYISCGDMESNVKKLIDMIKNGFDIESLENYFIIELEDKYVIDILTQAIITNPENIQYFKNKIMDFCDKNMLKYYDLAKKIIENKPNNIKLIEKSLITDNKILELMIFGIKILYDKETDSKIFSDTFHHVKSMIGNDKLYEIIKCFKIKFIDGQLINGDCPICLEPNCNTMLKCSHQYCNSCVYGWLIKDDVVVNDTCPLCRHVININTIRNLYSIGTEKKVLYENGIDIGIYNMILEETKDTHKTDQIEETKDTHKTDQIEETKETKDTDQIGETKETKDTDQIGETKETKDTDQIEETCESEQTDNLYFILQLFSFMLIVYFFPILMKILL
jgi:hypothetical protein